MKSCPYCAELIQDQAAKCRYCGEWLDPSKRPAWSGGDTTSAASGAAAPASAPQAATLPVGSGSAPMSPDATASARSWSAPAWLANAQAQKTEPTTTPTPPATPAESGMGETALRMERIRQSAAEVGEVPSDAILPATRPPATRAQRARLEVEPGVTLPAGSLQAVGVSGRADTGPEPTVAPQPAPVVVDDDDDDEYEASPRRRRSRPPAETAPRRKRVSSAPAPRPEAPEPEPEPEPRRKPKRAAPPPAEFFDDDDDDDFDDEPEPRGAGAAFDDGFLDDDDEYDDDEYDDDDDFGDLGPAPTPLPWKPIALVAGILAVLALVIFRDSIFPSEPDETLADASDTDTAGDDPAEGDQPDEANPADDAEPATPEPKAEGEGQPVEPEGGSGGEATGSDGAVAPAPAVVAPLDAQTLAKLDEARTTYSKADGNAKKLEEAGGLLSEILTKSPDHPEALTLMAQVYLEQDKVEESLALATRCTTVAAEHADCWLTIGVIQDQYFQKYAEAQVALQKYVDLSPDGRYARDARSALAKINRKLN